jgi:hypothetical protein
MEIVTCILCGAQLMASTDERCLNCGTFDPKGCPEPGCDGNLMVQIDGHRFAGCSIHNNYHYIGSNVRTPDEPPPQYEGWELFANVLRNKTPVSSKDSTALERAIEGCRKREWPAELSI